MSQIKDLLERFMSVDFPFDVIIKQGSREIWIKVFGPSEKYIVLNSDGTWKMV